MTGEQETQPVGKQSTSGHVYLSTTGFYLLAAAIHFVLIAVSQMPGVHVAFLRLGWRLGPWRSFPFPYDFSNDVSQPFFPESMAVAALVVTMVLGLACVVAALHSLTFAVVVGTHAWFGWPEYWKDVRSRISLGAIWATSARRGWWAWPVGQFVWLLLDQIGWGYRYACYPIINNGPPQHAANIVAVGLVFGAVAARVLRSSVRKAVGPDDLRCGRCGYLLRGLETPRCPECGYESNCAGKPEYRLRWQPLGRSRAIRNLVSAVFVAALLLAPVWLPLGLMRLPRNWLRYVPAAICPPWQVLNHNPNMYPISLDAVCFIRHNGSIALIRFERETHFRAAYTVSYWSSDGGFRRHDPPDSTRMGYVDDLCGPRMRVGPWTFGCGAGGRTMFWLMLPDETFQVEVFTLDGLPSELRWAVEVP